jgi:putative tryptophan/tyrosine transport system substrate-binding protein
MAQSGAICTYGSRLVESYRRVAYLVDRILQGAKPVELPIEQPTALELVVNARAPKFWVSRFRPLFWCRQIP